LDYTYDNKIADKVRRKMFGEKIFGRKPRKAVSLAKKYDNYYKFAPSVDDTKREGDEDGDGNATNANKRIILSF
jgi:hypothetical protein